MFPCLGSNWTRSDTGLEMAIRPMNSEFGGVSWTVFYFGKVWVEYNTQQKTYLHPTIDHKVLSHHWKNGQLKCQSFISALYAETLVEVSRHHHLYFNFSLSSRILEVRTVYGTVKPCLNPGIVISDSKSFINRLTLHVKKIIQPCTSTFIDMCNSNDNVFWDHTAPLQTCQ